MRSLTWFRLIACVISAGLLGCESIKEAIDWKGQNPACADGRCAEIDGPPIQCSQDLPCNANSTTPFCVDGICVGCLDSAQCLTLGDEDREVCFRDPPGIPRGECVQCDEQDSQAEVIGGAGDECQTAGLEVCDGTTHQCRGCGADGECTSGVCNAPACVAPADIAYVAMNGVDNPNCTMAAPCRLIRQAVAVMPRKSIIVVGPGTFDEDDTIDLNNRNVAIRADAASIISQSAANRTVLRVRGSSQVTVRGGTFDGSGDGNNPVILQEGTSALVLDGVTVQNSAGNGITTTAGQLSVHRSTIKLTALIGIDVTSSGPFELTRSTLIRNRISGLRVNVQQATIVSNVVVANGADGSQAAMRLESLAMPAASRIEFNTIADSSAAPGTAVAGVQCANTAFVVANSIVYGNRGVLQVLGCTVNFSNVQGGFAGTSNVDLPPGFAPGVDNYHLSSTSMMRGLADPNAALTTAPFNADRDDEARPQPAGGPADLGADEIP